MDTTLESWSQSERDSLVAKGEISRGLLGVLEAGTGILMFGVSTALFFAVIAKLLDRGIQMARKAKQ